MVKNKEEEQKEDENDIEDDNDNDNDCSIVGRMKPKHDEDRLKYSRFGAARTLFRNC